MWVWSNFLFTNKHVNVNTLTFCFLGTFFLAPIPVHWYEIHSGSGSESISRNMASLNTFLDVIDLLYYQSFLIVDFLVNIITSLLFKNDRTCINFRFSLSFLNFFFPFLRGLIGVRPLWRTVLLSRSCLLAKQKQNKSVIT